MSDMPVLLKQMMGELNTDFPVSCRCGMLVYTNREMTDLYCSNPLCVTHTLFNITEMLDILGIQANLGGSKAEDIMSCLQLKTHLDIFGITEEDLKLLPVRCNLPIRRVQHQLNEINKNGGIPMTDYMKIWKLNCLGSGTCNKLFNGVNDLEKFLNEKIMVDKLSAKKFIGSRIEQSPYTDTVENIYKTLVQCKDELIRCLKYFKICEVDNREISICITKSITKVKREDGSRFSPRDSFVTWLVKKYHRNFTYYQNFSDSVQFLICDMDENTPKLRRARALQRIDKWALDKKSEDPNYEVGNRVFTSEEFIRLIESGQI